MPQLQITPAERERLDRKRTAEFRRETEIRQNAERWAKELTDSLQSRVAAVENADPMRAAWHVLKRNAGGKEFTYLGRVVKPDMTFEDVLKKIPQAELETGARIAWAGGRLVVGRYPGSFYGPSGGPHFWTRMALDSEGKRSEMLEQLGAAMSEGFERQPEFIKRIIKVLAVAGTMAYEDLKHLAEGKRPPRWEQASHGRGFEELKQDYAEGGASAVFSRIGERLKKIEQAGK